LQRKQVEDDKDEHKYLIGISAAASRPSIVDEPHNREELGVGWGKNPNQIA
jgi:hypothetical protein